MQIQVVSFKCLCVDLDLLSFGDCGIQLGVGIVQGVCTEIVGCTIPSNIVLYNSIQECQSLCAASIKSFCSNETLDCGCGLMLQREPQLGCQFPPCPFDHIQTLPPPMLPLGCDPKDQCSCDFLSADVILGDCDDTLGFIYEIEENQCVAVQGCVDDLNKYPQLKLFSSAKSCQQECWLPCGIDDGVNAGVCSEVAQLCGVQSCNRFPDAACVACEATECTPFTYKYGEDLQPQILVAHECLCGCGDVNDDLQQNVLDVILILWNILEQEAIPSACGSEEADVVEDGLVDILDAVHLTLAILSEYSLCPTTVGKSLAQLIYSWVICAV